VSDSTNNRRPSGGVGGTRRGVKCLHAHIAWYLAGGDDPVGRWVVGELGLDVSGYVVVAGAPGATTDPFIPGVVFGPPTVCLTDAKVPYTVPGITPPLGCTGDLGRNKFTMPYFFQFDLRVSKGISFGERFRLDLIADAFNLFNHTNISAVNQLCDPLAGNTCTAGQPTAAYDARQFQFALKLNW